MKCSKSIVCVIGVVCIILIVALTEMVNRGSENMPEQFGKTFNSVDLLRKTIAALCEEELSCMTGVTGYVPEVLKGNQYWKEIANDYEEHMCRDSWGNAYMMSYEEHQRPSLRVWSIGPNKKNEQGGGDDINSWEPWRRQLRRYMNALQTAQTKKP